MHAGAHSILTFQQVSSTRGGKQTVEDDEEDADEEYVEGDAEEEAAGDAEQEAVSGGANENDEDQ